MFGKKRIKELEETFERRIEFLEARIWALENPQKYEKGVKYKIGECINSVTKREDTYFFGVKNVQYYWEYRFKNGEEYFTIKK